MSTTVPDPAAVLPDDAPPPVELAAQAVTAMEALEAERLRIRDDLAARIAAADLHDREIAEIYWRFPTVPVASLGIAEDVWRIAREHPWWSWRCQECGAEVFVLSRSEWQQREVSVRQQERRIANGKPPGDEHMWTCHGCWDARFEVGNAAHERRMEALRLRQQELRTMPYAEYLLTPEWQQTRRAALKRAGFACQVCNAGELLHVHHRTYERRGAELARDLIVLCGLCHALYHGKGLPSASPDGAHDDGTAAVEEVQGSAAAAWVADVVRDTGRGPSWRELSVAMNVPEGYSAYIRALIERGWLAWQEGAPRSLRPGLRAQGPSPIATGI